MATVTASLERPLENCSINPRGGGGSPDHPESVIESTVDDNSSFVDLNSHVSLPYHWEQCLDLKTGEIYYINWRNGMKAKEDPRTKAWYYSDEDEGSTTESSLKSSLEYEEEEEEEEEEGEADAEAEAEEEPILVVAGCNTCLMYYMVAKELQDCPKCCGQLLHSPGANHKPSS